MTIVQCLEEFWHDNSALSCQHFSKHWTRKQQLNLKKISYFASYPSLKKKSFLTVSLLFKRTFKPFICLDLVFRTLAAIHVSDLFLPPP